MQAEPVAGDPDGRARALGHFLRTRRARITPGQAGIPVGGRRRSTGLRREEVAVLAGVSPTWYTYLEQGRRIRPSAEVLDSLARVLVLGEDERRYLYLMSQGHPPAPPVDESRPDQSELDELIRSIGRGPDPVYIANQHTDIVAWNDATRDWYGDFGLIPPGRRNVLWWLFADPEAQRRLVNWHDDAREAVARIRSAQAALPHDPVITRRIRELRLVSEDFRRCWADHEVRERGTGAKVLSSPTLGVRRFRIVLLKIIGSDFNAAVVHIPID